MICDEIGEIWIAWSGALGIYASDVTDVTAWADVEALLPCVCV